MTLQTLESRIKLNEKQIKDLVRTKFYSLGNTDGAVFISELFIDYFSRRADLVAVDNKLAAFEIKSDKDTLRRLEGQIDTYLRLFEEFTIVCTDKHLQGVLKIAPENAGIWKVQSNEEIVIIRSAKTISQPTIKTWLAFLPVDELRLLMKNNHMVAYGDRETLLVRASKIPIEVIRSHVIDYFKFRRAEKVAQKKRLIERGKLLKNKNSFVFGFNNLKG